MSNFDCYFCNTAIQSTGLDATSIVVTINWDKQSENQLHKEFFCHLVCFKKNLASNIPLYLECLAWDEDDNGTEWSEETKRLMTISPEELAEVQRREAAFTQNQSNLRYECCFCQKVIVSNSVDITELVVTINCDKEAEKHQEQYFFCHLDCFCQKMHPNLVPSSRTCR